MIELPRADNYGPSDDGEHGTAYYTAATVRRLIAEAVEKEREAWGDLKSLGGQMANIAFNWSQQANSTGSRLTADERALLKDMQRQWDDAICARAKEASDG